MKILMALIITTILAFPVSAGLPLPKYWNCMQIGFMNDTPAMIVSDIQNGNKNPGKHYKDREASFAKQVKKVWNLDGTYTPTCSDFITIEDARSYYTYLVKKANESGLIVYPMEFRWKVKDDIQKKD